MSEQQQQHEQLRRAHLGSDQALTFFPRLLSLRFRREREKTGFTFYLESEWSGGQRVDRAGTGLLQVWKRQIQQLNRVSPDMASAILAAYPSPQLLNKVLAATRLTSNQQHFIYLFVS